MARSNRVGGILFLTIRGKSYRVQGDFKLTPSGEKRTAVPCENGVGGFSGEVRVPMIKGKILDRGDLDVAELDSIENEPITIGLGNGRVFVLSEAWSDVDSYSCKDGSLDVKFAGQTGQFVDNIAAI